MAESCRYKVHKHERIVHSSHTQIYTCTYRLHITDDEHEENKLGKQKFFFFIQIFPLVVKATFLYPHRILSIKFVKFFSYTAINVM